jgi:hypothetical protein
VTMLMTQADLHALLKSTSLNLWFSWRTC